MSDAGIEEYVKALEAAAHHLDPVPDVFQLDRDPDDAKYVSLALAADAEWIVSRDLDLLGLMSPGSPQGRSLRLTRPALLIVTPQEFLQRLGH